MGDLLALDHVDAGYGPSQVLKDVSLTVGEGEIVALLGANAAGKSTTMKTIFGVVRATSGTITYDGSRIERTPTSTRPDLTMALVGVRSMREPS